jgi:hypothetical protein
MNSTIDLRGNFVTSDIGDMRNPGGTTFLRDELDNTNATLNISATTGNWVLSNDESGLALLFGGTVHVDPAASLSAFATTLKDVTIEGDFTGGGFDLAGEITIHGTVRLVNTDPSFSLGDGGRYPNLPLFVHSGIFDLSGFQSKQLLGDAMSSGGITFGPDVLIHGGNIQATFVQPLLNLGQIIADPPSFAGVPSGITFPNTTITNHGVLAANGATLEIDHFAANEGTIQARAGGRVVVGSDFTQAATGIVSIELGGTTADQIGQIQVTGNATLAGTLQVALVNGFMPQAGNSFRILTFGSRLATFTTLVGWDLPRTVLYENLDVVLGVP